MKEYMTVEGTANASYEIKKSQFYSYIAHVEDEAAARDFITSIKKKHFDARHNCSAWVLGPDSSLQKSNDDGEPGGTAGNPILEAIKQKGLTDVVVVVTRYFGGIKLGAGGLIRAYSHSATLGLDAAAKIAVRPFSTVAVTVDYTMLGSLENWVRNNDIRTGDAVYTDSVTLNLLIEPKDVDAVSAEITDMTAGRAIIDVADPQYLAIKI